MLSAILGVRMWVAEVFARFAEKSHQPPAAKCHPNQSLPLLVRPVESPGVRGGVFATVVP
jgi:hypothetical protein